MLRKITELSARLIIVKTIGLRSVHAVLVRLYWPTLSVQGKDTLQVNEIEGALGARIRT